MPFARLALALSAALAALWLCPSFAHAGQWLSTAPLPGPADGPGGLSRCRPRRHRRRRLDEDHLRQIAGHG